MKNYLRNLVVLIFLSIVFTACQNFFNGDLKRELDEAVEIANSRELTVELNLRNSNSGSIVPQGLLKAKRGQVFSFELSIKNGYDFDGTFNVWGKENGRNIKILNVSEVILFEKKSEYNAGVGSTHYSYEAKILKDVYDSFLINPYITIDSSVPHPEGSALPVIRELKVTNRYGDGHIVDYFDLDLFVEDKESEPEEKIVVDFYDVTDDYYGPSLSASVEYEATCDDVGNGNYHFHTTVDMRNVDGLYDYENYPEWDMEFNKYTFKVTVDNAVGSASKSYNNPLKRQSYSKTQVQVYNYYDINYADPTLPWSQTCSVNYDFMQHSTEFSKILKLMVLKFDKEGFGLLPDGRKSPIKYGFCQNFNEIETLELNNVISDYNAFDVESEYNEMQPLWYEASQINNVPPSEPDPENAFFYEEYDKENGAFLEDEYNEAVKVYNEAIKEYYQVLKPRYEWLRAECNAGYQKYERKGEQDKAIINIPFPSNLDPKKDIYIKITTDNGINDKNFEVFTISAPPKLESIEVKPSQDDISLNNVRLEFFDAANSLTMYMEPTSGSLKHTFYASFYEPNNKSYPFYVYSLNNIERTYENMTRKFQLCSYGYDTYKTEVKELPLKKFSSDDEIEIKSAGTGTKTHVISVKTDRDVINQFDKIFCVRHLFVENKWVRNNHKIEVSVSADNKISFSENTSEFYVQKKLDKRVEYERAEYRFEIMGVKDGIKYWMDSPFIIDENDTRIEDNVPPDVELKIDFEINWDTFEIDVYPTNVFCDSTGSFLTIEGFPIDMGGNLAETTDVSIEISGTDYNELIEMTNCPIDKYLSIPISNLKNDKYQLSFTLSDTKGNIFRSGYDLHFYVNRKTVSMNEIEDLGSSFRIKDNSDRNLTYSLNYFNASKNDWETLEKGKALNGVSSEITKTGVFQLRIRKEQSHPADNYVSYPYFFHFPEKKPNEKDFLHLQNSVRVYTDQPFFIHTLKSDVDWGNDVNAWESHQSYSYVVDNNNYLPFEGSEVNPVYRTEDYSNIPYSYKIPWDKLDKKYAAIVIIWGNNQRDLIPIDLSLKY